VQPALNGTCRNVTFAPNHERKRAHVRGGTCINCTPLSLLISSFVGRTEYRCNWSYMVLFRRWGAACSTPPFELLEQKSKCNGVQVPLRLRPSANIHCSECHLRSVVPISKGFSTGKECHAAHRPDINGESSKVSSSLFASSLDTTTGATAGLEGRASGANTPAVMMCTSACFRARS
jgi:hypothetical protein